MANFGTKAADPILATLTNHTSSSTFFVNMQITMKVVFFLWYDFVMCGMIGSADQESWWWLVGWVVHPFQDDRLL